MDDKEPTIVVGTTGQYWRGDKTFQDLNSTVVEEGSNLYFTQQRSRNSISSTEPIQYDEANGIFNLSVVNESLGGTGQSTYQKGDILYSSSENTLNKLSGNPTSAPLVLTSPA